MAALFENAADSGSYVHAMVHIDGRGLTFVDDGAGFLYRAMLPTKKPGAYQFRVGVRDAASAKVGSASQFVRVPDVANGRLALSGISLNSRLEAAGSEQSAPVREAPGGPALRIFRLGEPIYCGVVVYNPAGGKGTHQPDVQVVVRVLGDDSEVWRGEPYSLKIDGRADPRRVPFVQKPGFGPRTRLGYYVIQVYATSKASPGKRSIVTQWTYFELVAAR